MICLEINTSILLVKKSLNKVKALQDHLLFLAFLTDGDFAKLAFKAAIKS